MIDPEEEQQGDESPDAARLTSKQEKAIPALLEHPTLDAAAKAAGVTAATLRRWMKQEAFTEALRAARLRILDVATIKLRQATDAAVDTLKRNLTCGSPGAEIRAAQVILDTAYKSAELEEMEERIAALEDLLADKEERERAR